MLPPGRAKLETRPVSTGAPAVANTIGITDVACFAARVGGVLWVRIMLTLRWTNSAAIAAKRSVCPSAQRYSMMTLRPSVQPSSPSRCTKAAVIRLCAAALSTPINPMTGTAGCWARTAKGNAVTVPPTSVMNSRRLIASPDPCAVSAHPLAQSEADADVAVGSKPVLTALKRDFRDTLGGRHSRGQSACRKRATSGLMQQQTASFDDRVGAEMQRHRHGETERFRGLEVDDKFEFGRLFDWQV